MERRGLGTSGVDVPVVGMGTWRTFDVRRLEEVAARKRVVDVALEVGSNLFDSSPMYGAAERVLGEALAGRRDRALVATKVWTSDDQEAERQIDRALSYYAGCVTCTRSTTWSPGRGVSTAWNNSATNGACAPSE